MSRFQLDDNYPTFADEAFDRLHRAGWSLGVYALGSVWVVEGINGENMIRGQGDTGEIAWRSALEQARSLGILAMPREVD